MKKVIVAFIAGALLMLTGQALADTVSQIGNRVDSEASVYVNGKKVSDAIIIKGKSYAPARDIANELGAKVEWKGNEGIVITNNDIVWEELKKESDLKAAIITSKTIIERLGSTISKYTSELDTANDKYKVFLNEEIDKSKKQLDEEKAKLAQYEAELAELESTK